MTIELRREPVHSPFGGSSAPRVLRCPASVDLIQKVPAYLRKPSAYADRGTACHAAIARLLAEDTHGLVGASPVKRSAATRSRPMTSRTLWRRSTPTWRRSSIRL